MYIAVINHPVKDFAAWKEVYDNFEPRRAVASAHDKVVQSNDDPNNVIVIMHFEDLEKVNGFLQSEELKQGMQDSGVVGVPTVFVGRMA